MKIFSGKDIKMITGILAASMLLGGCSSVTGPNNGVLNGKVKLKNDPAVKADIDFDKVGVTVYDAEIMDSEYRRYCFDLFSRTVKGRGGEENVMISPASVMMALDMVAAGAKGESLKQLTDLFAAGQGPLTQQAYAAALMDKINGSGKVEFSCANAIWNNGLMLGDTVNMDYVEYILDTFLAEYTVTDFNAQTDDEINGWIYEHTDHMISEVINDLDPSAVMVLVNAISFDGEWEEPYDEDSVRESVFTCADGNEQTVTFLYDTESAYFESEKATGFMKRYKGGEYAFLAVLPKDANINANVFAENFTAEDYEAFIKSKTYEYEVHTRIPELESDFMMTMNDPLCDLGAEDIFDPARADLSGITGNPGDIYVSEVIHKTHIEVDAKGTRASAATAITLARGAALDEPEFRTVYCNRPFVYAIVDTETMAPVFIGTVNSL
ncbi:MAG: serpin family protein [Lachnospiraceae bacterium]|nr:serpin family protein [Lachnospiraceae bacterium]